MQELKRCLGKGTLGTMWMGMWQVPHWLAELCPCCCWSVSRAACTAKPEQQRLHYSEPLLGHFCRK